MFCPKDERNSPIRIGTGEHRVLSHTFSRQPKCHSPRHASDGQKYNVYYLENTGTLFIYLLENAVLRTEE